MRLGFSLQLRYNLRRAGVLNVAAEPLDALGYDPEIKGNVTSLKAR